MKQSIRRAHSPEHRGKVVAYLAASDLRRQMQIQFAALPDQEAFWQSQEFRRIRRVSAKEERLTLDNVLICIGLRRNMRYLLKMYSRVTSGQLSLTRFVKIIITPRYRPSRKPEKQ